jgi:hypothetical protein
MTRAVSRVRCIVARDDELGDLRPIYAGAFTRARLYLMPGRRSVDPQDLALALEAAEDVQINRKGRTREVGPLEEHTDPALGAAIEWLDSRSGDKRQLSQADAQLFFADAPSPSRPAPVSPAGPDPDPASEPGGHVERFANVLSNSDANSNLRYEAINALRDQASPDHHDAFVNALTDTDQYVREAATEALADQAS